MNFKFYFLLIFFWGCGVKGNPVEPKNSPNPSILQNYPDIEINQDPNNTQDPTKF